MKSRVTFALFAFATLTTTLATAQMSDGEKKAAARAAYSEGVALQDKGNPSEALDRFEAAQKLFDAPTHLLHVAECQALTGKLVEASETYETLIRKPLGKDAPDVFVQAQEQAKAELTQLRPRIPTMRIVVKPAADSLQDLQISINERRIPSELVDIARPVNPGSYKLTASATGWSTSTPVDVEMKESEAKSVELTLQRGGTGAAIVGPSDKVAPPYDERPAKPQQQSPSSTGLLLGLRPGYFVPVGEVAKDLKFQNFASGGPGIGVDVIGRLARIFLVGGTLEFASLGAPKAGTFPAGTKAEVSARSIYAGVLAGIMPNVDRVTFVADAGFGIRLLSRDVTIASSTASLKSDETYSGLELAINAGLSIPAGPVRIVPKAGLAFGQFSDRSCGLTSATSTALTGCRADTDITTAYHTVLQLVVGVYYHVDFAKKSGAKSASPFFTTASR